MSGPNFWNDKNHSEAVVSELNSLKNSLTGVSKCKSEIEASLELIEMLKIEDNEDLKK